MSDLTEMDCLAGLLGSYACPRCGSSLLRLLILGHLTPVDEITLLMTICAVGNPFAMLAKLQSDPCYHQSAFKVVRSVHISSEVSRSVFIFFGCDKTLTLSATALPFKSFRLTNLISSGTSVRPLPDSSFLARVLRQTGHVPFAL